MNAPQSSLLHGGRLRAAAAHYQIPLENWLDLSTAINANPWPVPENLPAAIWQRLPETEDGLEIAARAYYGKPNVLPIPGSQAAIELLPRLLAAKRAWVPAVGYQEHAFCWQKLGYPLTRYHTLPSPMLLQSDDVVVLINPNNPTGSAYAPEQIYSLALTLERIGGWLIVDEAFMDSTPAHSVLMLPNCNALIVLRSFGKFFGLAGLRLGFCVAKPALLDSLNAELGPWAVNHPARWIAKQALQDYDWHAETRIQLRNHCEQTVNALRYLLSHAWPEISVVGIHPLFITLKASDDSDQILYEQLAKQAILVRHFPEEKLLRLGIPANSAQLERLINACR
ncbi:Cobalamin biosynthesis protein, aminopropanol attachment [gamma proteobacterium HdN1]|nr:Cobalamin biosynthesis protein, aminopropanol attachment [gamma proteobacterium HdN1]